MDLIGTELVLMRQMQDTKQDKRNPTLPTNLLSSFGWAYRYSGNIEVSGFPKVFNLASRRHALATSWRRVSLNLPNLILVIDFGNIIVVTKPDHTMKTYYQTESW